jgi:hypothetical protein
MAASPSSGRWTFYEAVKDASSRIGAHDAVKIKEYSLKER